jgi:hypothetical protein
MAMKYIVSGANSWSSSEIPASRDADVDTRVAKRMDERRHTKLGFLRNREPISASWPMDEPVSSQKASKSCEKPGRCSTGMRGNTVEKKMSHNFSQVALLGRRARMHERLYRLPQYLHGEDAALDQEISLEWGGRNR